MASALHGEVDMLRACGVLLLMAVAASAQDPPWARSFVASSEASDKGHPDLPISMVERAWQTIRDAGPDHPMYGHGVWAGAERFEMLGRPARGETILEQAIAAAHALPKLERELRIVQAEYLRARGKEVAAEAAWEALQPLKGA